MTPTEAPNGEGLRALAAFAAGTAVDRLPRDVIDKARACLLYAMGVGVACMGAKQPAQAARAVADVGGATRFFDDAKCEASRAAFANATLFHSRVQDDAHPAGHVGVVVVPSALAVAEASRATGNDLLAALVSGYEVALRIGRDHTTDSSARGFRTTPIYGVFGAAAAAGRLYGLDGRQMTHALSLAANMAGGLREYSEAGSEDFAFQAGMAAQNGIIAAQLALAGATSAPSALDGAAGFFRAYGEPGRAYAARLTEHLGDMFEMLAVTYKPYPICQFHRGIVRGVSTLSERAGDTPLAALRIRMHPFEADFYGVRFAGPYATFPQTFMSAPFCAALAWARRDATFAGLTDFHAPDVLSLVSRVEVIADPERERYAPRLDARLADGAVLTWQEHDRAEGYLLTWDNACCRTQSLAAELRVPPEFTTRMIAAAEKLADVTTVEPLVDAMREMCRCAHAIA